MKIEPNIVDGNIEKQGLYSDAKINDLQERLDTIDYQLDMIGLELDENNDSIDPEEKAKLLLEKRVLEEEKMQIEQELKKAKEHGESEPESADTFTGNLDEGEGLYSARDIGQATVPHVSTRKKQEAKKVEEEIIRTDPTFSPKNMEENGEPRR